MNSTIFHALCGRFPCVVAVGLIDRGDVILHAERPLRRAVDVFKVLWDAGDSGRAEIINQVDLTMDRALKKRSRIPTIVFVYGHKKQLVATCGIDIADPSTLFHAPIVFPPGVIRFPL